MLLSCWILLGVRPVGAVEVSPNERWSVTQKEMARATSLAISPDSKWIATGGYATFHQESPYQVHIRDAATGKIMHSLPEFSGALQDLNFSRDGKWLVGIRFSLGKVMVWNTSEWKLENEFEVSRGINLGLSPDGETIAVISYPGGEKNNRTQLTLHDRATGKKGKTLVDVSSNQFVIQCVQYSGDGKRIYGMVQKKKNGVIAWDAVTGKELYLAKQEKWGGSFALHEEKNILATTEPDKNHIHLFDLKTGKHKDRISLDLGGAADMIMHPSGTHLLVGNRRPKEFIQIINLATKQVRSFSGRAQVWHLRASPDAKTIAYVTFFSFQMDANLSFGVHDSGTAEELKKLPTSFTADRYKIGQKVQVNQNGEWVTGYVAQLHVPSNRIFIEYREENAKKGAWFSVSLLRYEKPEDADRDPFEGIGTGLAVSPWVEGRQYKGVVQDIRRDTGWVLVRFDNSQPRASAWVRVWNLN